MIPVVTSSAAQTGIAVASPAAIVAKKKPSMKTARTAAPSNSPMPSPSDETLRLSSSAASSSSSRTIALARSATSLTAAPRPCGLCRPLVPWVGIAPPVDPLGQEDAGGQRGSGDQPGTRAAATRHLLPLRPRAQLRARRRLALGARLDQARLQLPDEVRVLCERLGELGLEAALACHLVGKLPKLVRCSFDCLIGCHFLVGGSSPVSVRQIRAEARRAPTAATAAMAP